MGYNKRNSSMRSKVNQGLSNIQGALSASNAASKAATTDAKKAGAAFQGAIDKKKKGKKNKKKEISAENLNLSEAVNKENIQKGVLNSINKQTQAKDIYGKKMINWSGK